MKRSALLWLLPIALVPILSGCAATEQPVSPISVIYAIAAALALLLLLGYCLFIRPKTAWFVLLFSAVTVINFGYFLLSVSTELSMALAANRLAYLGSVLLPPSMLLILLDVTHGRRGRRLPVLLFLLAAVVFLIAASQGLCGLYYKDVSFAVVNGVGTLVKVYGPLHPLYLFYLLGYFTVMVVAIIRARLKKSLAMPSHAILLAIAVFVNIGVWLIEQFADIRFEVLSLSYIISELFLLGVHLAAAENRRLRRLLMQVENAPRTAADLPPAAEGVIEPERLELFMSGLALLTPTERAVYEMHTARLTTKEILKRLDIKENTLKYHNRNLYGKLGVSSKKELLEICKAMEEISDNIPPDTI